MLVEIFLTLLIRFSFCQMDSFVLFRPGAFSRCHVKHKNDINIDERILFVAPLRYSLGSTCGPLALIASQRCRKLSTISLKKNAYYARCCGSKKEICNYLILRFYAKMNPDNTDALLLTFLFNFLSSLSPFFLG